MGLTLKRNGDTGLDVEQYRMKDKYALALSLSLKVRGNNRFLNLDTNSLTDKGAMSLIDTINSQTSELNLSNNPLITEETYSFLVNKINDNITQFKLRGISLEGNKITDLIVELLTDGLSCSKAIEDLNLSGNLITSKGAKYISEFISMSNLQSLLLHWNGITNKGSGELFHTIKTNSHLLVFDISFNPIGSNHLLSK